MVANQMTKPVKTRFMIYGQSSIKRSWRPFTILFIHFLLVASCITLWLILGKAEAPRIYAISLFIVLQFFWSLWSWKMVKERFFDPYTIFLVAAYLFNGGKAFLELFHLNEGGLETFISNDGYVIYRFSSDTIERALLLVFIGLSSLHLGALLAASRERWTRQMLAQPSAKSVQSLRWIGLFLLVISFVPMVVTLAEKYRVVLQSGYFGLF